MYFLTVTLSLIVIVNARSALGPTGSYLPVTHVGESSGHFGSISNLSGGLFGSSQTNFGVSQGTYGSHDLHGTGVQDHKHVYFFAAPEEEVSSRLRIQIVPNSQRNTKIIFVKAPSYGAVQPEVIAPPSISEDKTLVYVLVKRPDHGGSITIPAGAGVKASKPEVYFIKYRSQHDAQQQIVGGLQGQPVGATVPDVGSETSFVSTLDSGVSTGSNIFTSSTSQGNVIASSGSHTSGIFTSGSSSYGPAGASGPY